MKMKMTAREIWRVGGAAAAVAFGGAVFTLAAAWPPAEPPDATGVVTAVWPPDAYGQWRLTVEVDPADQIDAPRGWATTYKAQITVPVEARVLARTARGGYRRAAPSAAQTGGAARVWYDPAYMVAESYPAQAVARVVLLEPR